MCHSTVAFSVCAGIVFRTFRENKVLCKGDGRVSKVPHIRTFPTLPSPLDETIFIHISHVIRRLCALAKSSASEHTQSASETCATPQWLLLSLNACGIICLMRPATAVFWSPRYSDGFKHVTAMFVLLAVPMRSQYSMQLALMYNCELINALLKTFGGLYALVDVVASFHVGPKPPERQSMIRY